MHAKLGDREMRTNRKWQRVLGTRSDREPLRIAGHDEAKGRVQVYAAFAAVASALTTRAGVRRPKAFYEAARSDVDVRSDVTFIVRDVRELRALLELAHAQGPNELREARLLVRSYYEQKEAATLAGYEVITVDVSMLSDEIVKVAREVCDVPPALVEYQQHPTAGTWARAKKEIAELQDRVRTFLMLGARRHESPTHRPAA